jgi:2-oxo-4-hydroxy-4-carboxy-5-ureidoimidazoline decarboxylase
MTLQELNTLEGKEAQQALLACCGSTRWTQEMTTRRPFASIETIHAAAHDVWWSLSESDWLEAFARHPKIGETRPVSQWSSQEQKGMSAATSDTADAIAAMNHEYQERFGYIFIVCATGKSAAEMRDLLEQRLKNNPQEELRIAASEQMKITYLRLDKLLHA